MLQNIITLAFESRLICELQCIANREKINKNNSYVSKNE